MTGLNPIVFLLAVRQGGAPALLMWAKQRRAGPPLALACAESHDQIVDYRLCRIEHALNIETWQACPDLQQLRGGGPVR